MSKEISLRDAFFDRLYEIAKQDRDVILVSADMGAPSLDKFRQDLRGQYINVGIAEQSMITVATGLALSGKKVYVYAIEPFVSSRIHEFIKLDISLMNVPITIIGIGAGFSYEDSGPTHHTTEEISIIRPLPNMEIFNPSDSVMSAAIADITYRSDKPAYIRLDRELQPVKYKATDAFNEGFFEIESGDEICIVATGNLVSNAVDVQQNYAKKGIRIGVIDLFKLKPINTETLTESLSKYKHIISWEEHLRAGGMGSILSELITDNQLPLHLSRIGVDDRYCYLYGSRKNIQKKTNIYNDTVIKEIDLIVKKQNVIVA